MNFEKWFNDKYYSDDVSPSLRAELEAAFMAGMGVGMAKVILGDEKCSCCGSISGVYLDICDNCVTQFNVLKDSDAERGV